jgi:hypothetical protein
MKSFGKDILKKGDVFGRFFYLVPRKSGDGASGDAFQSPVLPFELCDLIMDFLFDDRGSLCNCSLVCSAWLPTTRLHLFNTIKMSQFKPRNGLPDALRTIITRRKKNHMDVRLGKLLRSPKCTFTKHIRKIIFFDSKSEWSDKVLGLLLSYGVTIHELCYAFGSKPSCQLGVELLPLASTLTYLTLCGYVHWSSNVVVEFISRFSSLQELHLLSIFTPSSVTVSDKLSLSKHLHTLTLEKAVSPCADKHLLLWLLSQLNPRLINLQLLFLPTLEEARIIKEYFESHFDVLRTLWIRIPSFDTEGMSEL